MDGIYSGRMAGPAGRSIAIFVVRDGTVSGGGDGGVLYDGALTPEADGYRCTLHLEIPPGTRLITGAAAEQTPSSVSFTLPGDVWSGRTVPISTTLGPLSVTLSKLRDL